MHVYARDTIESDIMTAAERREEIATLLVGAAEPISAGTLAVQFSVSRQVIVGDIALLRAAGIDIQATPRGYIMLQTDLDGYVGTIACRHGREEMRAELYAIIDNGGNVLDVIVEHPIYGQLVGQLHLFSRHDVDEFAEQLERTQSNPLSEVTDGIHLHTIHCQDEEAFFRIKGALAKLGVIYE